MLARVICITSFLLWTGFCVAKTKESQPDLNDILFNVSFLPENPITFVGKKSTVANSQSTGSMMYPADTAGLFFVSILAHAAVSGGIEKSRLNKEQEETNKVLEPYSPYIAAVNESFLWDEEQLTGSSDELHKFQFLFGEQQQEVSRWELKVVPVFAMTQNQSSFLIYNKMTFVDRSFALQKNKKAKKQKKGQPNPNEKLVVIVSDPVVDNNKADFWLRDNAKSFKEAVKNLYMESFRLGVAKQFGVLPASDPKQITIKYLEDGVKKIERGYVISQSCRRTVFESLAGEIKSVPNLDFSACSAG